MFNDISAQTDYIIPQQCEIYHAGPGDKSNTSGNDETQTKEITNAFPPGF